MAKKHKISAEEAELLEAIQENSAAGTAPEEQAAPAQPAAVTQPKPAPAPATAAKPQDNVASMLATLLAVGDKADAATAAVKQIADLQAQLQARLDEADAKKARLNDLAVKVQETETAYKMACDEVLNKDLARTRAWEAVKAAKGGDSALRQLGAFLRHPIATSQSVALANLKFEEADKAVLDAVNERDRLEAELESAREALDIERSKA